MFQSASSCGLVLPCWCPPESFCTLIMLILVGFGISCCWSAIWYTGGVECVRSGCFFGFFVGGIC